MDNNTKDTTNDHIQELKPGNPLKDLPRPPRKVHPGRTKDPEFSRPNNGNYRRVPTVDMQLQMIEMVQQGKSIFKVAKAIRVNPGLVGAWCLGKEFPEWRELWLKAKQVYAMNLADDIMVEASAPLHENPKMATAEVARRRLIVDTSKWVAGKLLAPIYGEKSKVEHEHSGQITLSPLAQLRQLESGGPIVSIDDSTTTPPALPAPPPALPSPPTEEDCF
jgi:hypothetical protein